MMSLVNRKFDDLPNDYDELEEILDMVESGCYVGFCYNIEDQPEGE